MNRKIKIGICGSQGTGKTTKAFELATALKKEGHDVFILSEVARSCPFPINEGVTKEAQMWILGKTLTREQSSKGKILIGDRTLLDVLAYGIGCNKEYFEPLKPFVKQYMETYDIIFFMEPNPDYLIDDGIRSTNQEFQDEIDIIMKDLLCELEVPIVTTDNHVEHVLTYLEENK